MARARVRSGAQWSDACILNVSTRGMLIQSARPVAEGSVIEIVRGDHFIFARVVWSEAGRSGLRSEVSLPVEDILSLEHSRTLRLIASNGVMHDRRKEGRGPSDPRLRGRAIEFVAVAAIAATLAIVIWDMAQQAFSSSLASVSAALAG